MFLLVFLASACTPSHPDDAAPPEVDRDSGEPDVVVPEGGPYANCSSQTTGHALYDDTIYAYWEDDYDALGNWVTYRSDGDQDGEFEENQTAERDAAGDLMVWLVDNDDRNTLPDERYTYTRDADGFVLQTDWDNHDDGTVDGRYTYDYDEHGHLVYVAIDDAADGSTDAHCTGVWTEADGIWTDTYGCQRETGEPTYAEVTTWSADGLQLTELDDNEGDGPWESSYAWTWSDDGGVASWVAIFQVDGVYDSDYRARVHDDSLGRLSFREYDWYQDGDEDDELDWEYDCPW